MTPLKIVEFGNLILRKTAKKLSFDEIQSTEMQQLIKDMHKTLVEHRQGVALAAPQVGKSIALIVIAVRPTKHRPKVSDFDLVLINPVIVSTDEDKSQMWEGCLSGGSSGLFAKTPRHKKISVEFTDEIGQRQKREFGGLHAQIIQHEVDHLNGILFVDRVTDTKTYMTLKEYRRQITPIK